MNLLIWVSIGILGLGLLICLSFLFWGIKRKAKAIKHYEEIRDKLTLREKQEHLQRIESGFSLGNIVGILVALLISVTLLPVVSQEVSSVSQSMNVTNDMIGATSSMSGFVTLFFALTITVVVVVLAMSGIRDSGII